MSSMRLGGRMEPENLGSATIGKAVKVVGQIHSKEDLFVDGDLEGTVEALEHKLTTGSNGTVHADVKARNVAVLGSLEAMWKPPIRSRSGKTPNWWATSRLPAFSLRMARTSRAASKL